jgi:hypothetical protein
MKIFANKTGLIFLLIAFGAVFRVIPHPANFAPIAALGMFSGIYLGRRAAFVIPLLSMLISDYFIGFDSIEMRLAVYGSLTASVGIGYLVKRKLSSGRLVLGSLAGSTLFYLVTNLVFLYPAQMYERTVQGQMLSYINALPFFRNTIAGDLFYSLLLVGIVEFARRIYLRRASYAKNN